MKIVVLLKQTPDTEALITLTDDGKAINESGMKFIVNPYDEYAIEEALKLKEKTGGEVAVMSFGNPGCRERILRGLAMGADRGVLVDNRGLEAADSLTVAKVLAKALSKENADLVLCGKQGIDDDNMHVGVMTAALLGWPHVNVVTKVDVEGDVATVEREVENSQVEVYKVKLPVLLGAHKSLNTPRYASLPGIMKAKRKPFETLTVSDLGLDPAALAAEQGVKVTSYEFPPKKAQGKVLKDAPVAEMVGEVVTFLKKEAKVLS